MNSKILTEQIAKIAPKFRPEADDLSWFESELDKLSAKALPRLLKKRFAQSLSGGGEHKTNARAAGVSGIAKPANVPSVSKP